MYPIKFQPIYKEMVWGGQRLKTLFNRELPYQRTGESWDVSLRVNEMSIAANGQDKGEKFVDIINKNPQAYLGKALYEMKSFPLLIKLISADDNLSVQVHPDDDYAQKIEQVPYGKSELWYILDAPADSFLIIGIKDNVSKENLLEAIRNDQIENYLNKLPIQKGDVINIPAGLVHALTKNVTLAEIQQNSDTTYRLYDYNRLGLDGEKRELHIEKALDVIDFDNKLKKQAITGLKILKENHTKTYLIANKNFAIIKYELTTELTELSDEDRFFIFTCVEGELTIETDENSFEIKTGDSIFIPAFLGKYTLKGSCSLIKSFVPHVENDFISVLLESGYSMSEIVSCCDVNPA